MANKDLRIYYDTLLSPDYIDCWCTRWDQEGWNIVIGTFLNKSDVQTLMANTVPGAVGELYSILGRKVYTDLTWTGDNTLKLHPNSDSDSTLKSMREDTIVYVKNISTHPLAGTDGWMECKIECVKSGNSI